MKTILTQNTLILLIAAFAVILAFTACSDVVSPGDVNEELSLQTESTELQDIRRRMAAAAETTPPAPTSCTLQDQVITYGGNGESAEDRIANGKKVATLSVSLDDGKITLFAKVDDPNVVLIKKTEVFISKDAIGNGNSKRVHNISHNPSVEEYSYTHTLIDEGISPGDDFNVSVHIDTDDVGGGSGQSAWSGEESGHGNRMFFIVTNSCPASGTFNSAG